MGTGFFLRVKQPGRGVDLAVPYTAEVKEKVELYIYSPSGPSCMLKGEIYIIDIPGDGLNIGRNMQHICAGSFID
jgi:hypothetical protein